jgi:hypothetical protein
MQFNIFKEKKTMRFSIIDVNMETHTVRVSDSAGNYYDVTISQESSIYSPAAKKNPTEWFAVVEYSSEKDLEHMRVNKDDTAVGLSESKVGTYAKLEHVGVYTSDPMDNTAFSPFMGASAENEFALTPPVSNTNYQEYINIKNGEESGIRPQEETSWKANADGVYGGAGFVTIRGGGGGMMSTNGQVFVFGDRFRKETQEEKPSHLFCTNMNFLDHYFIGLANAVSFIPMPHVVDLIEMGRLAALVKNVIKPSKELVGSV